jgi:UDP-sugar pyrophosphorylase
LADLQTWDPEQ